MGMSKKNKNIRDERIFSTADKERVISDVLKFSRKRFKRFDEVILQLYLDKDLSAYFSDRRISKVHECFSRVSSKTKAVDRAILKNVLVYLDKYSLLVSGEEYIQVVFNMIQFRAYWRRDVFEWKPSSKRGASQVHELAYYLFCHYAVPEFLYKAFFETSNMRFINWFIHIGTGKRIRDLAALPFPFTQKMGHYFLQAPSKFSIQEALRWAQVKGLNGDDKLAERVAYSWLSTKPYEDENFWEAFIRVIVQGGMFNHDKLTELIDYVRETKRENRIFDLKGRTLQSLLRHSDEWHKKATLIRGAQFWSPSGIEGYKLEKKQEVVIVEELTGSKLLADEGRSMRHCVASYVHYCVTGKSAIFSMRKYTMGILLETMATIEVNLSLKRVVQAKGKMNRKISDEAKKHLEHWANKNELALNPFF
jgi:PcfJ-like protein